MVEGVEVVAERADVGGGSGAPPVGAGGSSSVRLWRNGHFNVFWAGQTLSAFGDAFATIALPLLVLRATGSVAQMGLVTATFGIGQFVAGLFAGMLVDRVDRRKLMIVCDVGRMLVYGALPLGWWLMGPQLWLVYVVVGLASLLAMTFSVAYVTAIANLVDRDQIIDANGRLQATLALGWVLGPMLAGLISARVGPATAVGVDAVTFAISALSLTLIHLRPSPVPSAHKRNETSKPPLAGMLVGIRFLLHEPVLRAVMVLFAGLSVLVAGGNDLFIYHFQHDLGQGDSAVGLLFGAASIGGIVGAVVAPRLRRWLGFGPCWLGGLVASGIGIALIGVVPTVALAVPPAVGFVLAENVVGINGMTIRQEITPDHLLGRVTSAYFTVGFALGPLGAAATTLFAAQAGAPVALVLMGLAVALLGIAGLLTPARERRPEQRAALYAPDAETRAMAPFPLEEG